MWYNIMRNLVDSADDNFGSILPRNSDRAADFVYPINLENGIVDIVALGVAG
jgi:hypothetical protein